MWPLTSTTILGAWSSAVPRAGAWVAEVLCEFDMPCLAGSAKLVAGALVTNAVEASWIHHHATVTVWLWANGGDLLIEVWDGSPEPPAPITEPNGEGGRGLAIVAALSKSWGYYPDRRSGKVVWAYLVSAR
jgi:hypothetical protein